ncbi:MAG: 3-deoxy-manno-octulosonate cytidylyltransferase [Acidobacteriota bacterium]|nr:3-deoxy-manno-octulosonate cytidylyltransferase [Acidobacteriota bacterium]
MHFVGVIPARFNSTRLPGKPLIEIAGKPMIQWVHQRARQASRLDDIIVATDDERIFRAVEGFEGKAVMTSADHPSGTDRVAEVAQSIEGDVFINIQGDEPLIPTETIDSVCAPFERDADIQVTTACVQISDPAEVNSPHAVKVVFDPQGRALYFSRATIPHRRGVGSVYKHLGIYGYRRDFLRVFSSLPVSPLEKIERLEQLRLLENGIPIHVVEVPQDSLGVDTDEDLDRVRPLLENEASGSRTG